MRSDDREAFRMGRMTDFNNCTVNSKRPQQSATEIGREERDPMGECAFLGHAETAEVLNTSDEVDTTVTLDSGAVDHVIGPKDLPGATAIEDSRGDRANRTFVNASGDPMENLGECTVLMHGTDDHVAVGGSFAVTEVTRPLHSVSRMCDEGCEVLFTSKTATVRKDGRVISTYQRRGGLYVRNVKLRAGDRKGGDQKSGNHAGRRPQGFTRPNGKR